MSEVGPASKCSVVSSVWYGSLDRCAQPNAEAANVIAMIGNLLCIVLLLACYIQSHSKPINVINERNTPYRHSGFSRSAQLWLQCRAIRLQAASGRPGW